MKTLKIEALVNGVKYGDRFKIDDKFNEHDAQQGWLIELARVAGTPDEGTLTAVVEDYEPVEN